MSDEPGDADDGDDESGGTGGTGERGGDATLAVARLRGKRAALGIVIVISLAFIVASTSQIIPAVFGVGFEPLPSAAAPDSPEGQCAAGIRALAGALDRAGGRLSSVASAADDGATMAVLRSTLSPEWDRADAVHVACKRAAGGPSAWAALQRLRVAEEQSGRLDREALTSVRRDVAAHLPADLR
jgi:hypothetical protein